MPKKRISSSRRPAREVASWLKKSLKKQKFLGLALAGGKTDKTCFAIIEYYPNQQKIFLSDLETKIMTTDETSSDQKVIEFLKANKKETKLIGVNVPLSFPKCIDCELKCPGYEKCKEPEIKWMWKHYRASGKKKKLRKLFTPYTERCAEQFISANLEEPFHPQQALGANMAPLTARMHFLARQLKMPWIEVYPKLSLWRVGRSLGIQKNHLRAHKHAVSGEGARHSILEKLIDRDIAFIYEQDRKTLVENSQAFDAFICALTGVLKHQGQCEEAPKDFPLDEAWIDFPKMTLNWPD